MNNINIFPVGTKRNESKNKWEKFPRIGKGVNWQTYHATKDELEKIEEIVSDTKIIIIFPSRTFRKYPDITTHIEKNYFLEKTFKGTLGDGDILLYSKYSTN